MGTAHLGEMESIYAKDSLSSPFPLSSLLGRGEVGVSCQALQMGLWGIHGVRGIQSPKILQGGYPGKSTNGANSLSLQPAQGLEMDRPWCEGPKGTMTGQEGWWDRFPLPLACRQGGRAALSGRGLSHLREGAEVWQGQGQGSRGPWWQGCG